MKFLDMLKEIAEEQEPKVVCKCGWGWEISKGGKDPYVCHKCGENVMYQMITEKLCPKGRAYADRRIADGEQHSAYLMGRAVQVCSGGIGKKKKKVRRRSI